MAPPTDMSKQEIEYTQEDDNIQILDIETSAPISTPFSDRGEMIALNAKGRLFLFGLPYFQ